METMKVDTIPFNLISIEYTQLDMGTDIEPLQKWKKAHWDFLQVQLKIQQKTYWLFVRDIKPFGQKTININNVYKK
nr:hypothetical protein [uncultured Formosa sp.]